MQIGDISSISGWEVVQKAPLFGKTSDGYDVCFLSPPRFLTFSDISFHFLFFFAALLAGGWQRDGVLVWNFLQTLIFFFFFFFSFSRGLWLRVPRLHTWIVFLGFFCAILGPKRVALLFWSSSGETADWFNHQLSRPVMGGVWCSLMVLQVPCSDRMAFFGHTLCGRSEEAHFIFRGIRVTFMNIYIYLPNILTSNWVIERPNNITIYFWAIWSHAKSFKEPKVFYWMKTN